MSTKYYHTSLAMTDKDLKLKKYIQDLDISMIDAWRFGCEMIMFNKNINSKKQLFDKLSEFINKEKKK